MTNAENGGSGHRLGRLIAASRIVNSTLDLDRLLGLILESAPAAGTTVRLLLPLGAG